MQGLCVVEEVIEKVWGGGYEWRFCRISIDKLNLATIYIYLPYSYVYMRKYWYLEKTLLSVGIPFSWACIWIVMVESFKKEVIYILWEASKIDIESLRPLDMNHWYWAAIWAITLSLLWYYWIEKDQFTKKETVRDWETLDQPGTMY